MTRRPHIDRRALFASGAAAALLAATGVTALAAPQRGGRLRAALSGAHRDDAFDSRQDHGLFMKVAMSGMVYDTLTEVAADGTLRGELAKSWQGSQDARSWVFELREDVFFHDGQRFGPEDVSVSFALHATSLLWDVTQVVRVGPSRVRVELEDGDPDFPYRLSDPRLVIYPAENLDASMRDGIGTGLYRVRRFQSGRHLLGERVRHHFKDGLGGWFDEVELMALSSDAVRAEALRDHYVDVVDLTHSTDLQNAPDITMLPEELFMTTAVDSAIGLPSQIGKRWPLDNLKAAERWWRA